MRRKHLHLILAGLGVLALSAALDISGGARAAASDYEARLAEYQRIHGAYQAEADAYWNAVSDKRRIRNAKRRDHEPMALTDYVLTQPPVYAGPRKPIDPSAPREPPPERPEIPVVADFLPPPRSTGASRPSGRQATPSSSAPMRRRRSPPGSRASRRSASIASRPAAEALYDTQAGLEPPRPGAHAISPALGYNQLLVHQHGVDAGRRRRQVRRRAAPQGGGTCRVSGAWRSSARSPRSSA